MNKSSVSEEDRYLLLERFEVLGHNKKILIIVVYSLLMFAGVFLNSFVLSIIVRNRILRTLRNIYIASLMCADLLVCSFCIPFTLIILLQPIWTYGVALCKMLPFIQGTSIVVSTATIVAIGFERYCIVSNFDYKRKYYILENPAVGVLLLWIFSLLPSLPFLIYQNVKSFTIPNDSSLQFEMCVEVWPHNYMKDMYSVFFIIIQLLVPALVLLAIGWKFRIFLRNRVQKGLPVRIIIREKKRNRKIIRMLTAVAVVFALSWLPYHIDALLHRLMPLWFVEEDVYLVFAICHMIAMSSVVSNPILYALFNSNLKSQILRGKYRDCKASI